MEQSKKWIILSMALIFLVGLFGGIATGILMERGNIGRMRQPQGMDRMHGGGPGIMPPVFDKKTDFPDFIVKRMAEDLSLSEDQQEKLSKIFKDNEKDILATRDEMRQKFIEKHKEISIQIKAILNDEQKKKYDEMDRMINEKIERGEMPMPGEMERGGKMKAPRYGNMEQGMPPRPGGEFKPPAGGERGMPGEGFEGTGGPPARASSGWSRAPSPARSSSPSEPAPTRTAPGRGVCGAPRAVGAGGYRRVA